jgi:hypothetical protein
MEKRQGSKGARERGSEGARERGSEGARAQWSRGARERIIHLLSQHSTIELDASKTCRYLQSYSCRREWAVERGCLLET